MKHLNSISCVGWLWLLSILQPGALNAQSAGPELFLRGIIRWPGHQLAVLENPKAWSPLVYDLLLEPGQRDGDVELRELRNESAKLGFGSRELELFLLPGTAQDNTSGTAAEQPYSIQLENVRLDLVLQVYQKLAGRTLLRPARLPDVKLSIPPTGAARKLELLKVLDRALSEKDLSIQPHRDKFAFLAARPTDFTAIKPELWSLIEGLSSAGPSSQDELLPPGMINFPQTDAGQALAVFQELARLTIIRPTTLPLHTISLRTESELTRTEAVYAFAASFALNGVSIQPAGDKFLLMFPSFQTNDIAEMLIRVKPRLSETNASIPAGAVNFPATELKQVIAVYQELLGKSVESSPSTPCPILRFQNQSALSKSSIVYGLELLLAVNGLYVVPNEAGNGFKVVPRGALRL